MERRIQEVRVKHTEFTEGKDLSSNPVGWVKVELNTGHTYTCRPDQAPKAGDLLTMTLEDVAFLDVVLPFAATDVVENARAAVADFGGRTG